MQLWTEAWLVFFAPGSTFDQLNWLHRDWLLAPACAQSSGIVFGMDSLDHSFFLPLTKSWEHWPKRIKKRESSPARCWLEFFSAETICSWHRVPGQTLVDGQHPTAQSPVWVGVGFCLLAVVHYELWSSRFFGHRKSKAGGYRRSHRPVTSEWQLAKFAGVSNICRKMFQASMAV